MRREIHIPALRPQKGEIAPRRFAARQDHQPRIAGDRLTGAQHHHLNPRLQLQRVKVIEIRDARELQTDDLAGPRTTPLNVERILGRQIRRPREIGHHAKPRPTAARRDQLIPIVKETRIAAKFIDEKAPNHRCILRIKHQLGPEDLRNHPAPVNVPHQHHRHIRRAGKAHIGNIPRPQIDLGRAAGSLDNHQINFSLQPPETLQHRNHQLRFQLRIIARLHRGDPPPLHHHLRAHFALRLQQNRVHIGMRQPPRGQSLQRLRTPDLAAVHRHGCIVGHVLRLERCHRQPAAQGRPAETRHNQRLAHVRARPLDHQRGHRIPPPLHRTCLRKPPAEVFFAKKKGERTAKGRRASGRPGGGNAALSPWAVIGTSPCTALKVCHALIMSPAFSSWYKYLPCSVSAGEEVRIRRPSAP